MKFMWPINVISYVNMSNEELTDIEKSVISTYPVIRHAKCPYTHVSCSLKPGSAMLKGVEEGRIYVISNFIDGCKQCC